MRFRCSIQKKFLLISLMLSGVALAQTTGSAAIEMSLSQNQLRSVQVGEKRLPDLESLLTSFRNTLPGQPQWGELPPLPDPEGFAGMFAVESRGLIFAMGGANFPEKKPWEGGTKKWYANIYKYDGRSWELLSDKLKMPLAYGAAVNWHDTIFIAGGSSSNVHTREAGWYAWNGKSFSSGSLPSLPQPVSNTSGILIGDRLIIAGGNTAPGTAGTRNCYALDLSNRKKGWYRLTDLPAPGRIMPALAAINNLLYLFSGEAPGKSNMDSAYREILDDSWVIDLSQKNAKWKRLNKLPKAYCAGGSPLPVNAAGEILFWGGVDAATVAYADQKTHPGWMQEVLIYNTKTDTWKNIGKKTDVLSVVTLPVAFYRDRWVYVSGEVRPAVRTNKVITVSF